jgi:RNA polymerase sigma factor (sigma-70 family)
LAHLDPEDRVLLVLRFVEGRTMEEIASRTGLSLEQAKYRVKRASTALRRVLVNDLAVEEAEA